MSAAESEALTRDVLARLRREGMRLAVAESCTGGEVLAALTGPAGASDVVWGGAVVYSAAAKSLLAGVDASLVREHGVVSAPVTGALADGIRRRSGTEVGLAVTGWAGPGADGAEPVGTVYLGVAVGSGTRVSRAEISGSRDRVRQRAVCELLRFLLDTLDAQTGGGGAE